jgi:DNA topoisomerase-1
MLVRRRELCALARRQNDCRLDGVKSPTRQSCEHVDPVQSAADAGLRYVTKDSPGFTRKRRAADFIYLDTHGKVVKDKDHLARIRSLVLPPAWENVWICPNPNGHLQAVGVDARGRTQYRYHPRYREVRNETKFRKMLEFSQALPTVRKRVAQDLTKPGLPREKVLATVVRLLETTFIRIGNVEYARENESFGLTTLRNRHAQIEGSTVKFHFRGKSKQEHEVEVHDRRLAKIIRECQDLPGHELFQYVDESGQRSPIDSCDVNDYLKQITGADFTAKDFRTWAGTVHSALHLAEIGPFNSDTEAKRNIVAAVKYTAQRLGNRPATCRKYYIHPEVLEAYTDGTLLQYIKAPEEPFLPTETSLHPEEQCVVKLIRSRELAAVSALVSETRRAA